MLAEEIKEVLVVQKIGDENLRRLVVLEVLGVNLVSEAVGERVDLRLIGRWRLRRGLRDRGRANHEGGSRNGQQGEEQAHDDGEVSTKLGAGEVPLCAAEAWLLPSFKEANWSISRTG